MSDELRTLLYYPLGLLPSLFFTLRILIQWAESEKHQRSYTGKAFWRLSLAGNILLLLHYTVQVQYPFALLRAGNAVISLRNLDLMSEQKRFRTSQVIWMFFWSASMVTLLFLGQSYFIIGELDWIRTPVKLFDEGRFRHHLVWHIVGSIGGILFASRFWIQWWDAEWRQKSELGKAFWWTSIAGSLISLVYFIHIGDTVSTIHFGFGIIPYARNLILIRRARA